MIFVVTYDTLGMYLQDIAFIKEQMPDIIEPGGFINFAKRQKLSESIMEVYEYQQQPPHLQAVPVIQV